MKEYRLKFLNDREFEALSLVNSRYINTKDDFGFADMKTDCIFVRKTGVPIIDQFVTQHEIEEILSKYSNHEDEFAIRHKKGGAARNILPIVLGALAAPFTGGSSLIPALLGAASSIGMNQYAQAKHPEQLGKPGQIGSIALQGLGGAAGGLGGAGVAGAIGGGIKGATAAAPGFLSKASGAITGAGKGLIAGAEQFAPTQSPGIVTGANSLTNTFNASQAANPALGQSVNFGGNAMNITGGIGRGLTAAAMAAPVATGLGFAPLGQGNYSAVPTSTSTAPGSFIQQGQQSLGSGTDLASKLNFQTPVTGNQASAVQSGVTQGTQGLSNIQTQAIPGGLGGIGSETAKITTKTPMLEKLLGANWRQTILGAAVPLLAQPAAPMFGAQATAEPFSPEQSQLFNDTVTQVKSGAQVQLTPAQQKSITDQYDSALETARQNIMDRYKMLRPGSDIENDSQLREALLELETEVVEKKANALASVQLGLSQQQTQMMSELAAMDIYTLSMKAGISYAEARDFKNMLGQMGYIVSTAGQPIIYNR